MEILLSRKKDIGSVDRNDIKMKLPQPNINGGTARAVSADMFNKFVFNQRKNNVTLLKPN